MLLCPAPSVCPVSSTHSETKSGTKFKLGVRYTCSPRQTVADRAILDQITPGQSHPQDTQNIDRAYKISHNSWTNGRIVFELGVAYRRWLF